MRFRSRVLLTAGLACLSTAMLAGGALAYGGQKPKFGKISKRGHAVLQVEVRGAITDLKEASASTDGSITVSASRLVPAPPGLEWTCVIPKGTEAIGLGKGARVKLRCRSVDGILTAVKLRHRHYGQPSQGHKVNDHDNGYRGNKVWVEARGTITAIDTITPGKMAVTVDPGTTEDKLLPFMCNIGPRTRIFGTPMVGDTVRIECKSRKGALVAKKLKEKGQIKPGEIQVRIRGRIDAIVVPPGVPAITFGPITCGVADTTLLTGLAVGNLVEARCAGNPLTLTKIHLKSHDDH